MADARDPSPLGPLLDNNGQAYVVAGASIGTPPDVSLSDDSLGLTPPKPGSRTRQPRGRSGSAGGTANSTSGARKSGIGVRRTASSGPKRGGLPRLPSPALTQSRVQGPTVVPTLDATPEARLYALEQQRQADHIIMRQMAEAIANLRNVVDHTVQKCRVHDVTFDEQLAIGLEIRRELAAINRQQAGTSTVDTVAAICESKFAQLDGLIQQLNAQDANVAAVIQSEHDKSKDIAGKDGNIISGAFDAMDKKLSHVSELVRKFDNGVAASGIPASGAVFTHAMNNDMRKMHDKMELIDTTVLSDMFAKLQVLDIQIDATIISATAPIYEQLNIVHAQIMENRSLQSSQTTQPQGSSIGVTPTCAICDPNPWAQSTPPGMGMSSSSGDNGFGTTIAAVIGGNGICHCIHVTELQTQVNNIATQVAVLQGRITGQGVDRGPDPLWNAWSPTSGDRPAQTGVSIGTALGSPIGATSIPASVPFSDIPLPLNLREGLGSIGHENRPMFDVKMTQQDNFKFNGNKDGVKWKVAVERYFISCAPVLMAIFEWAEKAENEPGISVEDFQRAVGPKLSHQQVLNANAQLWGFLSNLISGSAETIFKRATKLNGLDAWRRLVRHIDHGAELRLDSLKREMKIAQNKPIKTLNDVELGVAEYENAIQAYTEAGGLPPTEKDKKDDLLNLLPEKLQADLMWHAKDKTRQFNEFRDIIVNVSGRLLAMQKPQRALQGVQEEDQSSFYRTKDLNDTPDQELSEMLKGVNNVDDLVAAFQKRSSSKGNRTRPDASRKQPADLLRNPRKCPNCGETHPERVCPKPSVAVSDRKCWTCGKPGHSSSQCPNRKAPGGLKALTDIRAVDAVEAALARPMFHVDHGFQEPTRTARHRTGRPMPTKPTLADFVHKTRFDALATADTGSPIGATLTPDIVDPRANTGSPIGATPTPRTIDDLIKSMMQEGLKEAEILSRSICHIERCPEMQLMEVSEISKKIKVAMDSAAVDNVVHPNDIPECVEFVPNSTDSGHFVGANNSKIENFGTCRTSLNGANMAQSIGCDWTLANVTRALHSVAKVTGDKGEENHKQDVLFDNDNCFVVPPGIVKRIMQVITAVATYEREGNLYTAEMEVSSFPRQGPGR